MPKIVSDLKVCLEACIYYHHYFEYQSILFLHGLILLVISTSLGIML